MKYRELLKVFQSAIKEGGKVYEEESMVVEFINANPDFFHVYSTLGLYYQGLENYKEALNIRKTLGDKIPIASSYNNIGLIYKSINQYEKSLENYNKSLQIYNEIGDKKSNASILNNIGNLYLKQKSYELALEYFFKALEIRKQKNDINGIANSSKDIGEIYNILKKGAEKTEIIASKTIDEVKRKIGIIYHST